MAGTIFWMTAAPSYPDYDGFTIYLPATPAVDDQGQVQQGQQVMRGYTALLDQPHTGPMGTTEEVAPSAGQQQSRLGGLLKRLTGKLSMGRSPRGTVEVPDAGIQASAGVAGSCSARDTAGVILAHAAQVAELNRQSRYAAS